MSSHDNRDPVSLVSFIPDQWFTEPIQSSVWITFFRVYRVSKDELVDGPKTLDLGDVFGIFLHGDLQFPTTILEFDVEGEKLSIRGQAVTKRTGEGDYLVLLTPFTVDGQIGNEAETRERIRTATGLLAAIGGRNVVYERYFDGVKDLGTGEVQVTSDVIVNPLVFPIPDLSDHRLGLMSQAERAIRELPDTERNRIALSLRWFEAATYVSGVDSYLRYWIALETLAMPDTSNIRPIREALARAYDLDPGHVTTRFHVGRLFGLRGLIVHEGRTPSIHSAILDYIGAVYADVLFDCLGLESERRAEAVTSEGKFDFTLLP